MVYVKEAMLEALRRIQDLGFVVMSAEDREYVEVLWMREDDPPDINPLLDLLQFDQNTLLSVLRSRTIQLPLWFVLGYPWERPLEHWQKLLKKHSRSRQGPNVKKRAYARAAIQFYEDNQDITWKTVNWEESWPILG